MMINKIDPLLYQKIQAQNLNNKPIDCIVYSNNYRLCKIRLYETESGWVEYAE